jgi:hypothetical protein
MLWSLGKTWLFLSREGEEAFGMLESRKQITIPSRDGVNVFGILDSRKYITISLQGRTAYLWSSALHGEDVTIFFQVKRAGFWNSEVQRGHHRLPPGREGWPL